MPDQEIDLESEVKRLRDELRLFRETILPALQLPDRIDPSTRDWQRATTRLIESLPSVFGNDRDHVSILDRSSFKPFMIQGAATSYAVRNRRIYWEVTQYTGCEEDASLVCSWLGEMPEDPVGWIREDPHGFGERLLEIPADQPSLWNALSLIAPILADADPHVLRRLLDPETYRRRVQDDRSVSPETSQQRSRMFMPWFGLVLHNALLHALGGLAKNHFGEILDLLNHPHLMGRYTDRMPQILFTVLFEKSTTLTELYLKDILASQPPHVVGTDLQGLGEFHQEIRGTHSTGLERLDSIAAPAEVFIADNPGQLPGRQVSFESPLSEEVAKVAHGDL